MTAGELDKEKLPRHIAVIMDGNGRWARKRSLERIMGHRRGMESVRRVVKACRELGIEVLSLYAFSTENWRRPTAEVRSLMLLLKHYIQAEIEALHDNNICVRAVGSLAKLPPDVHRLIESGVEKTRHNSGMVLNVALSYSGRDEIVRAVVRIAEKVQNHELQAADITEQLFAGHLDTADLPDPDLLIRTSGELRISNFLLWQIAYTELYVTDVLWPDFTDEELYKAIADYQHRSRRFGRIDEQVMGTGR
jgi:undecaprenyl diphosphate synthase